MNMEKKSIEIWTDNFKGPSLVSITERACMCPHLVEFDGGFYEQVITFLNNVGLARHDFHAKGGLFFSHKGKECLGVVHQDDGVKEGIEELFHCRPGRHQLLWVE